MLGRVPTVPPVAAPRGCFPASFQHLCRTFTGPQPAVSLPVRPGSPGRQIGVTPDHPRSPRYEIETGSRSAGLVIAVADDGRELTRVGAGPPAQGAANIRLGTDAAHVRRLDRPAVQDAHPGRDGRRVHPTQPGPDRGADLLRVLRFGHR